MDYESLPLDYKNTFSLYTNLLIFIGLNIFEDKASITSKIRFFLFNITLMPFICGQCYMITKFTADNFLDGAQLLPIILVFLLDIIKISTILLNKTELKHMILEVGELWPTTLVDERAEILDNWIKRMKNLVFAFFLYAAIDMGLFVTFPLVTSIYYLIRGKEHYLFPFLLVDWWPVTSPSVYLASYIWELVATVPCQVCLYLPCDLIMITMTSNVSVLFRLLQEDLKYSVGDDDSESYGKIVKIIKTHQKLLRISNRLSKIFGLVIFIHVAFSAIVICFFGFLALVFSGVAETIANLITVLNGILNIFLLALAGQQLCDSSSEVSAAAYQSMWYKSNVKVKRLVLFIIIRSQKICYLSALGFSNVTLRSFSKIMSTAWTYFSLLIQVYGEK